MATCKGDRAAHAQLGGEGGGGAAKADAQGQGGAQDKAPPAITEPPRAAEGAAEGAEAAGPSADAPADDGVACGPCAPRARELDVREDVAAAMREAIAAAVRADHPEREGHEACQYYHKTGMCKFGQECRYHHPPEASRTSSVLNNEGLPLRPGERICPHFQRTGACKFGYECRFDHPGKLGDADVVPAPNLWMTPHVHDRRGEPAVRGGAGAAGNGKAARGGKGRVLGGAGGAPGGAAAGDGARRNTRNGVRWSAAAHSQLTAGVPPMAPWQVAAAAPYGAPPVGAPGGMLPPGAMPLLVPVPVPVPVAMPPASAPADGTDPSATAGVPNGVAYGGVAPMAPAAILGAMQAVDGLSNGLAAMSMVGHVPPEAYYAAAYHSPPAAFAQQQQQ